MDTGIISLINFSKKFFEGRDINWIGSVGFISINDCVVRISYMNHFGPNGFFVQVDNKTTGSANTYVFMFYEFLTFPDGTKSANPKWKGFDLYWEAEPLNKKDMVDKIFDFIYLYV
jgi:hypothetical protein